MAIIRWPCILYEHAERCEYFLLSAPPAWQHEHMPANGTMDDVVVASWPDAWGNQSKNKISAAHTVHLQATLIVSPVPRRDDMTRLYVFRNQLHRLFACTSGHLASLSIMLDYGEVCEHFSSSSSSSPSTALSIDHNVPTEAPCLLEANLPKHVLTNDQAMIFLRIPQLFEAMEGSDVKIRMPVRCSRHANPPSISSPPQDREENFEKNTLTE